MLVAGIVVAVVILSGLIYWKSRPKATDIPVGQKGPNSRDNTKG